MDINPRQTLILAVIVFFLGRYLVRKVNFLARYNIPEPVIGGIVASVFFSLIYFLFDITLDFSLFQRDVLLVVFFTCVGLSSEFANLRQGGRTLLILLIIAICYLFIQNFTGIAVATLTGLEPQVGVLSGSVSLSGGHGTTIAWADTFAKDYGIDNASEIGIACATFGLVLGGLVGGPMAGYLIKRHKLKPTSQQRLSVGIADEKHQLINVESVFSLLLILSIAIGIGLHLHEFLITIGIKLPVFVPCLFGGIILTNTIPLLFKKIPWPTRTPTLALVSDVSLGLFLSMSLMSLQLWVLIDLALPILLLLTAQVIVASVFVVFIVFRLLGSNYEAAIMSSGYIGLALGATPTAIANMTAVTKHYGPAPQAFIVVPLIGAFFIDIANSLVIQNILSWLD
ncbi:MAG: sodium/glutamate symporter [Oleispira sp.]|nr:sodium/glutamate symporter [Oleispira sp.]MBL4881891.1 sodium/glutamate symporter [Oleispira sp.]